MSNDMNSDDSKRPPLLRLPVEIRWRIYQNCFVIHTQNGTPSKDGSQDKHLFPHVHRWLLSVCRQIHAEVFPIFAANHVMSFQKPLKFANEYLSFLPPQRLVALRHLRMTWPRSEFLMSSTKPTIFGDLWNLERLWDNYPELRVNLETFVFDLPVVYPTCSGKMRTLFRSVRRLIESSLQDSDKRYLLICRGPSYGMAYLCIRRVIKSDWEKIINGIVVYDPGNSFEDMTVSTKARSWKETSEFTNHIPLAVGSDGLFPLSALQASKNWKIAYQQYPGDHPRWINVLEEVDRDTAEKERIKARNALSRSRRKAKLQADKSVSVASRENPIVAVKPKGRISKVRKSKRAR